MVFQQHCNQNDFEQNDINPGIAILEKPYLPTEGDSRMLGLWVTTKKKYLQTNKNI